MADVACVGVADDVVGPFVPGRVCVSSADVFGLQRLELLEGAEFVCHCGDAEGMGEADEMGWAGGG